MIEQLLPSSVSAGESFSDRPEAELYPEEAAAIVRAVDGRRREYATVRACARDALRALGVEPVAILSGPQGEPIWPAGIVGSMTHCVGYRGAVVARDSEFVSVGVDAEVDQPLPARLIDRIVRPEERERLAQFTAWEVSADRLLFCVKEAVYKAWFPITRRFLEFHEASVTLHRDGTFAAEVLLDASPATDAWPTAFSGRWLAANGLLLSASAV